MPNTPTKPICSSCGYDLSGLIAPGASANCPECSSYSSYKSTTEVHSRQREVRRNINQLFILPMLVAGLCYISFRRWSSGDHDTPSFMLFFAICMAVFLIPGSIMRLFKEWRARQSLQHAHRKPAGWVSVLSILIPVLISEWVLYTVIMLWIEAIASV